MGTQKHRATEITLATEEREREALRQARAAGLWPTPQPTH